MTKEEIQQYLYEHIPVTKALGVEVVDFLRNSVKLKAPLSANINHRDSAFGGSISSLLITTGWSYLRLLFDDVDPVPRIVIGSSNVQFQKPVTADFTTELIPPKQENLERFLDMYKRFGKARMILRAKIESDGEIQAEFKGEFVVLERESGIRL